MITGTFGIEKESLAELLHEAEHGKPGSTASVSSGGISGWWGLALAGMGRPGGQQPA
jgi:hypothetical protein